METKAKISKETINSSQKAIDNHRMKILCFIYYRYISKIGIDFESFISSYK